MNENINLEYRMYGLVCYSLSGIQKGIQFGHAAIEYQLKTESFQNQTEYYDWAKNHKTFIILNGGTTNNSLETPGTMQLHKNKLDELGVKYAEFYEPDINNALTAIVFLVDERIYNRTLVPDFLFEIQTFDEYLEKIGGLKNHEIRLFLSSFKLA